MRDHADRWYDTHATELLDRLRDVQADVIRKMRCEAHCLGGVSWHRVVNAVERALIDAIIDEHHDARSAREVA